MLKKTAEPPIEESFVTFKEVSEVSSTKKKKTSLCLIDNDYWIGGYYV